MCTLCAALNPGTSNPLFDQHVNATGGLPNYTLDQIADQLTDGYWDYSFQSNRAFDLGSDRTLTYDVSALSSAEQFVARTALQAWTDVSGIRFVPFEGSDALPIVRETGDAGDDEFTTASMQAGQAFRGALSPSGDVDVVRIDLRAGDSYTIALAGIGGNELNDPYLEVYDAFGNLVASNDDANGLDSQLSFSPDSTGTYYLVANSYDGAGADYELTVREGAGGGGADLTFDNSDPDGAYATSELSGDTIHSS